MAFFVIRLFQRAARRATHRFRGPTKAGQWVGSAALATSHGANDAQKTIGVIAALLLATGRSDTLAVPTPMKIACAAALTLGTALGGWRIVKTIGSRIYRIRPLDGLASQTTSSSVILGASFLGAPISTTHVVASSIVGIGTGQAPVAARELADRQGDGDRLGHHHARDGSDRRGVLRCLGVDRVKSPRRWFLPETPDVLGMLRAQLEVTMRGMDALVAWAHGDAAAGDAVRALEHEADGKKRELQLALVQAFVTPYDAEDLYSLGRGIDWILNLSKDAVRESEVMACPPDGRVAEMATLLREGVMDLDRAVAGLQKHGEGDATEAADAAMKTERRVEHVYRKAMAELLESSDLRDVMARRELYRRFSRIAEMLSEVAERVWYAVIKEA